MGALEQLQQKGFGSLRHQDSQSQTTEAAERPAVLQRIELVTEYFIAQMNSASDGKSEKLKRMLVLIAREAMDEMNDAGAPAEAISFYFRRAAALTYWAATGERVINMPWPSDFTPPPELEQPVDESLLAIEQAG